MTTLKAFNDIGALYDAGPKILKNGIIMCPVCNKTYQTETGAKKHIEKRDCYRLIDEIKDTLHETKAYGIYQEVVAAINPKARVSINTFRKSPLYNQIARFSLFCSMHEVFDALEYLSFINMKKGLEDVRSALSAGLEEANLREFRILAHKYDIIPSDLFFQRYKDDLINDDDFFIRSVEKAKIGLKFLARKSESGEFPFEERCESLPIDYQNRLTAILDVIV